MSAWLTTLRQFLHTHLLLHIHLSTSLSAQQLNLKYLRSYPGFRRLVIPKKPTGLIVVKIDISDGRNKNENTFFKKPCRYWIRIKLFGQLDSQKNPFLKKKPNPLGFIGFWALLGFWIFYFNAQLGSLLVDLAYQLSFYLDLPVL